MLDIITANEALNLTMNAASDEDIATLLATIGNAVREAANRGERSAWVPIFNNPASTYYYPHETIAGMYKVVQLLEAKGYSVALRKGDCGYPRFIDITVSW